MCLNLCKACSCLSKRKNKKNQKNQQNEQNPELHIERPVYNLEDLHSLSQYSVTQYSIKSRVRKCLRIHPKKFLFTTIPVLTWWPSYNWRKHFKADVLCGIQLFVMQVPLSMAYGLLARVPPVYGLYMAFYHALIYFLFGTSRHLSVGPFAITCLLTGDVIIEKTTVEIVQNGTTEIVHPENVKLYGQITNTQVGITVAFAVAIAELAMYLMRMGIIANLLSDTMVSGFTCAAAFHVAASQIHDMLGINVVTRTGNFSFLLSLYDVLLNLPRYNKTSTLISGVSFLVIIMNNELAKPWMMKTCKVFFPMEIVVVIASIVVSQYASLPEKYNVSVAGHIPTGLPRPTLPVLSLLQYIWVDSIVIALVAYITALSVALMFARKHMYDVDANQELMAYVSTGYEVLVLRLTLLYWSLCNFIGSFLSCPPVGASLSLSIIQEAVGGVTQMASIMSSSLLLVVLLWLAPFFEMLPHCVLATVITVTLKRLLFQVKDLPFHWRLSRWDGFVWAVTFLTTLMLQMSIGLAAGVAASLFIVAAQSLQLNAVLLGRLSGTDLFLDMDHHKAVAEPTGMKILRYTGGVSFASRNSFRILFVEHIGFDPAAVLRKRARLRERGLDIDEVLEGLEMLVIILDFSSVTFLDPSGVDYLRHLKLDLHKLGITLLLAECSGQAYDSITNCDFWEKIESKFNMYPTVRDAVLYAETNIVNFLK